MSSTASATAPETYSPVSAYQDSIGEIPGIWPSTPYRTDIMALNSANYSQGIAISSIKIVAGW